MTVDESSLAKARELREVRQRRSYENEPVADELIHELLEVARWSGSSRNTQPWHFIVITDKDVLAKLGALRPNITWMEAAPLAIAIVLDHADATYDEGRVTERLLIAATFLGLGAGTAWFSEPEKIEIAKQLLGVPAEKALYSVVVIGHPVRGGDDLLGRTAVGRKPLADIVSYGRYGEPDSSV